MEGLSKILIICGAVILLTGLILALAGRVPFTGRLPGDFHLQWGNFHLFFPLGTCLVVSALLTAVIAVLWRLMAK